MAVLPYTTSLDVQVYCTDLVTLPPDAAEQERLVNRAVRDVDRNVALITRDIINGLRITPAIDLKVWQTAALSRAVGAQVAYRVTMGDEFFLEDQFSSVRGPEFSQTGKRSRLSPDARLELVGAGLLQPTSFSISTTPPTRL